MAVGYQALIVALLAGLVGAAELINRYRSDATLVWRSPAAWIYVALNAMAGLGALLLIRAFGWSFGATDHVWLWQVLVAGFAAITFFRSSVFNAKIGATTVGVGPSMVLGALLDACDRQIDRSSAMALAAMLSTSGPLQGLDSQAVVRVLPILCLALMQNFPAADQAQLGADLSKIGTDADLPDLARMHAVCVVLAKYLGTELVLRVLTNGRALFEASVTLVGPTQSPPPASVLDEAKRIAGSGSAST